MEGSKKSGAEQRVVLVETGKLKYYTEAEKLVPEMSEKEWQYFLKDVKERGIQEPLVVAPDGKTVLDGRHRLRAVKELNIERVPVVTTNLGGTGPDAWVLFALRSALLRRHLAEGQRIALADELLERLSKIDLHERAVKGGKAGGRGRGKEHSVPEFTQMAGKCKRKDNRVEAANVAGVSQAQLKKWRAFKKKNQGLASAVREGKLDFREAQRKARTREVEERLKEELAASGETLRKADSTYTGEIYAGSSRHMQEVADGSVNLIVTSPPYEGMVNPKLYGNEPGDSEDLSRYHGKEYLEKIRPCVAESFRVLALNGSAFFNFQHQTIGGFASPTLYLFPALLEDEGFRIVQQLVWIKTSRRPVDGPERKSLNLAHEMIFHAVKRSDYFANKDAVRRPYWPGGEAKGVHSQGALADDWFCPALEKYPGLSKEEARERLGSFADEAIEGQWTRQEVLARILDPESDVLPLRPERQKEGVIHPAKMPDALADFLILYGSKPGDTVLDLFGGIGTVPCRAKALGRVGVAYELNPEFVQLAKARMAKIELGDGLKDMHARGLEGMEGFPLPNLGGTERACSYKSNGSGIVH